MWGYSAIPIVGIVFGCILALAAIVGGVAIVWMIIHAITGGSKGTQMTKAEMQLVQEIHASLSEMEKRIEALETLLLSHGKGR